jgi:hypothetical protein
MRGLIAWLGFRQAGVSYERRPRREGASKAPFWHTVFFAVNAITSFSLKPLRVFTLFGLLVIAVSIFASFIYFILAITGSPPAGITTLILVAFFGIGLNSAGIGLLGEYLGRTYSETKGRPLYVVRESFNLQQYDSSIAGASGAFPTSSGYGHGPRY